MGLLTNKDIQRLWSKVVQYPGESACWGWTDALSKAGYPYFSYGGRKGNTVPAHRLLYELVIGPIPDGMDLDHLCRNRWCVRPVHQEPVNRSRNLLRGNTIAARNAKATHCPKRHPYDIFNTGFQKNSARYCRTCRNEHKRRVRQCLQS